MKRISLMVLVSFLIVQSSCEQNGINGPLFNVLTTSESEERCPAWSPNSPKIAYVSSQSGGDDIWTVTWNGWMNRQVTSDAERKQYPSFSPNGDRIAYAADGLHLVSAYGGNTEELFTSTCRHPSFSPVDDHIVYESGGSISVFDIRSHEHQCVVSKSEGSYNLTPSFSPDGNKVVFTSSRTGSYDIWIKDLNSGEETLITSDDSFDSHPCYSPDGTKIVFVSDRDGSLNLWIKSLTDGSITQLTHMKTFCIDPAWSHDGEKIAFASGDFTFSFDQDFWWAEEMPELTHYAVPEYPDSAKFTGKEGVVFLYALVGIDGSVDSAYIAKSDPPDWGFEEAVLNVIAELQFTTAFQYGIPVKVWVCIPFRFEIRGGAKSATPITTQAVLSNPSNNIDIYVAILELE